MAHIEGIPVRFLDRRIGTAKIHDGKIEIDIDRPGLSDSVIIFKAFSEGMANALSIVMEPASERPASPPYSIT